jgi:hypothetical protein
MAQIIGYLTSAEAAAFQEHAASGGLDASGLANLLVARELRVGRLPDLKGRFDVDLPSGDRTKITAHQRGDATKKAFGAHSAAAGLKPSPAAALLFRAELEERWLSFCLGIKLDSD